MTADASWRSSDSRVLRITAGGSASAIARGEANVNAAFFVVSPGVNVLVLESGTYRLSGKVSESGAALGGAAVEVVAGTGAGLRATTNYAGQYALYGVAGEVQVRASADGLEPQTLTVVVADNATDDVDLRPAVTPADLSGSWSLRLTASSGCSASLPDQTIERSFNLLISQQGTHFVAQLSSPTLVGSLQLNGRIFDRTLALEIPVDAYYSNPPYYYLLDRVDATWLLGIDGSAQAVVAGGSIGGTLKGEFVLYEVPSGAKLPSGSPKATCRAADHGFILSRVSAAVTYKRR